MTAVRFLLNGERREVADAPPATTVLDWLRGRAGLTGTKEGCAEGDCGACTIAVSRPRDGPPVWQAVNSCLMTLPQLDGAAVLTVEGLATAGALHPVQRILAEADATQCGYCTPGFVMNLFTLAGAGAVDDGAIHETLAGNLCRCTGYRPIVAAAREIAALSPPDAPAPAPPPPSERYEAEAQTFLAPPSLAGLDAALAAHPDAVLLGGGTDLGLAVSKARRSWPVVVSTARVADLRNVTVTTTAITFGSAVTYSAALPHLETLSPSLGALVRRLGSRQIRNLGTLAGNLATASPIGDTIPALIALDATLVLRSHRGARTLAVADFIRGYRRTALEQGEYIAAIRVPRLPAKTHFATYKLAKRYDQDISTVVAAFRLALQDGVVTELCAVYGGMAASARRAAALEAALIGRPWTAEALQDVDTLLASEFAPLDDHRGSAQYRLRAAANLLRRFQFETTGGAPARLEVL